MKYHVSVRVTTRYYMFRVPRTLATQKIIMVGNWNQIASASYYMELL